MKHLLFIALVAFALSANAKNKKEITILHTNDSHSCIYPLNSNLADTLLAGRGGYLRRINMLKKQREAEPGLLLLDSGDFSQGSPYYTLFKGDVEVELMNQMCYDASTIGNHEFDYGLDNMARLFSKCQFPIVCANYDFTGTVVEGLVKPYTIIKRDGVKIGIFGLSPEMDGLVATDNWTGVKFLDPIASAQKAVNELRHQHKCDVVICLSHLGWGQTPAIGDEELMRATDGIDIVLGGHSHTYMQQLEWIDNATGKATPNDQNGKHALYVGKIKLTLDKK